MRVLHLKNYERYNLDEEQDEIMERRLARQEERERDQQRKLRRRDGYDE